MDTLSLSLYLYLCIFIFMRFNRENIGILMDYEWDDGISMDCIPSGFITVGSWEIPELNGGCIFNVKVIKTKFNGGFSILMCIKGLTRYSLVS